MLKSILPLGLIISLRFFGLFVILPVVSIYVLKFNEDSAVLLGLAVGVYAISQMAFQIPFGMASDKFGRKKIIALGILIFIIGSFVCFYADDIYTFILGRFLQGLGAISSSIMAFVSDLVKEEQRAKSMATIGSFIALSFMVAMFVSPFYAHYFSVSSLFLLTAALGVVSLYILFAYTPNPPSVQHSYKNANQSLKEALSSNVLIMSLTNFLQKLFLSMYFVIIPIVLTKNFHWEIVELWKIYVPAIFLGIFSMGGGAFLAEAKFKFKQVLAFGILCFGASFGLIAFSWDVSLFIMGVLVFFIGFNTHEPIMQSLVTKYIKTSNRGKVLGFFNSCGYLGTFLGAIIGMAFVAYYEHIFLLSLIIVFVCILWLVFIYFLDKPAKNKNLYMDISTLDISKYSHLDGYSWCKDWYINNSEKLLVVKYDSDEIDENQAQKLALK